VFATILEGTVIRIRSLARSVGMNRPMDDHALQRAIYLTGPTAVGKTAVGVALARRLGAEIVAMDSLTIYRGLDIGTAKPTPAERGGIPHHLIDVVDPWESASVAEYREWALEAVASIEGRGRRALFVGGTALYLKTLLRGLFDGPGTDPDLRRRLDQEAESEGEAALHSRLAGLDPAAAARLHPNDRRRVIRALEVIELTGQPLSALQVEHQWPAPAGVQVYALELPRATLYDRINRRVKGFFDAGLVEEVRTLLSGAQPMGIGPAQGIGYREVIAMLAGQADLAETIDLVQTRSRQFAKRQATWFRGLEEVRPFPIEPAEDPEAVADRLMEGIR
jgi:tRNA dimethylallyltransferase